MGEEEVGRWGGGGVRGRGEGVGGGRGGKGRGGMEVVCKLFGFLFLVLRRVGLGCVGVCVV